MAGLLGVGGGLIIVPVLTFIFTARHLPDAHILHLALGTSLASIMFTSVSSLRAHHQRSAVDWLVVRRISSGIMVGTFGGSLSVPFLTWCNVAIHRAIGTSAAIGFPIALAGAAGYVVNCLSVPLPPYSLGFVYLPALIGIAAASIVTAPLGAKLAHSLPIDKLKKIFALLLIVMGTKMLVSLM